VKLKKKVTVGPVRATKVHEGVKVQLYSFITSRLGGNNWSASRHLVLPAGKTQAGWTTESLLDTSGDDKNLLLLPRIAARFLSCTVYYKRGLELAASLHYHSQCIVRGSEGFPHQSHHVAEITQQMSGVALPASTDGLSADGICM